MIVFKNQKVKRESLVRTFLIFASAVIVASAGLFFSQALGSENAEYGMKPETVANYLHAIIEADRTLYAYMSLKGCKKREQLLLQKAGNIGMLFRFLLRC